MGGRGGGSSTRSAIVVAQQNAVADLDIRDAYEDAMNIKAGSGSNPWVTIQSMRTALSVRGWSRERQDEQLRRFVRERKGVANPESNQKTLTKAIRDSALNIGNEDKHIFMVKN